MFAFDEWAGWLKSRAEELHGRDLACRYSDNMKLPKYALNPSFGVEMETADRLGSVRFWKRGTCDYVVFDVASGDEVVNHAGLDASDDTVAALLVRFISFFGDGKA